jgi:hypothetical protein
MPRDDEAGEHVRVSAVACGWKFDLQLTWDGTALANVHMTGGALYALQIEVETYRPWTLGARARWFDLARGWLADMWVMSL